mgnify:CR=1 FL=1
MTETLLRPAFALVQTISSMETSAVRLACMLMDGVSVISCGYEHLERHESALISGSTLPVGSVEYVRRAMELARIPEPPNISYAPGCERFLGRQVHRRRASEVTTRQFIKPTATKTFTGFVFDPALPDEALCEHDREQLAVFRQLDPNEVIWCSEVVNFVSEWRYYVLEGEVIGMARYDPGEEAAPRPSASFVAKCVRALALDHPYALDIGVTSDAQTRLVEINDAWAIGLYRRAMPNQTYYRFLRTRWEQLLQQRVHATA